jgi:hypothetical protein
MYSNLHSWKPQAIYHKVDLTAYNNLMLRYFGLMKSLWNQSSIKLVYKRLKWDVRNRGYVFLRRGNHQIIMFVCKYRLNLHCLTLLSCVKVLYNTLTLMNVSIKHVCNNSLLIVSLSFVQYRPKTIFSSINFVIS